MLYYVYLFTDERAQALQLLPNELAANLSGATIVEKSRPAVDSQPNFDSEFGIAYQVARRLRASQWPTDRRVWNVLFLTSFATLSDANPLS
jgi:hypothetical protein